MAKALLEGGPISPGRETQPRVHLGYLSIKQAVALGCNPSTCSSDTEPKIGDMVASGTPYPSGVPTHSPHSPPRDTLSPCWVAAEPPPSIDCQEPRSGQHGAL